MMQRMWKSSQRNHALATAHRLMAVTPLASSFGSALTHSFQPRRGVKSWAAERGNLGGADVTKPRSRAAASSPLSSPPSSSSASTSASSPRAAVASAPSELPEYDDEFTSSSAAASSADRKSLDGLTEEELNDALLGELDFDKIVLKNMKFFGHHGVYPHETATGQPFEVDLEMEADLSLAGETDDIAYTINYEQIHEIVTKIMTGPPQKLLERVSFLIIDALMTIFPTLDSVNVTIRKPKVGLKGTLDHAAVNMKRSRASYVPVAQRKLDDVEDDASQEGEPNPSSASSSSAAPPSSSSATPSKGLRTTAALKRAQASASSVNKPSSAASRLRRNEVPEEDEPEEEATPAQWEAQQKMFAEMDSRLAEAEKRAMAKKAARAAGGVSAPAAPAAAAAPTSRSYNVMPPLRNFNQFKK